MILNGLICIKSAPFSLAANTKIQAVNFALCLGAGALFGIFALLYFRRSSAAETFVTDLFATLAIGGGYICCLEFVFGGKFEFYGIISYLVGIAIVPILFKTFKRLRKRRRGKIVSDA